MRIAALLILLAFSAFFSGSETAFFSLSRFDVQRMSLGRRRGAHRVANLLSQPGKLLIAILAGNMIVNISATALMTTVFFRMIGPAAVPIAVAIMTIAVLIFGEISPKVIAVGYNARWAELSSGLLGVIKTILTPLVVVLGAIQKIMLGEEKTDNLRLDEVDIENALELAHRQGTIEGEFRELFLHFLRLDRISAEEIMLPRAYVPICDKYTAKNEVSALIDKSELSFCIIEGNTNERARIIDRAAIEQIDDITKPWQIAEETHLVPFSRSVADLFNDLRTLKSKVFIVLNEHGDIDGIIEAEALLLSVYGKPFSSVKQVQFPRMGEWFLISGETDIDDVNELIGVSFDSEHNNTIAGAVIELFGEIPSPGNHIEYHGWEIRVIKSTPRKLNLIGMKKANDDH